MHGEKIHAYGMRILKGFRPNGPLAVNRDTILAILCILEKISPSELVRLYFKS